MIRLLHMTDTHIQGQTPALRTDDFPQTLLKKLVEIGEIARKYDVDAVLHTGDILERPDTGSGIVGDLVEILLSYEKPIVGIVGNHDSWGQNPKSMRSTVLNIVHKAKVIDFIGPGDKRFIEKDGICLRITGQPFHYEIDRRDPMLDYYVDKTDVGLKVYLKRNEELMLGPMKVKQIKYYFFDNRLYRIVVTTDAEYEDILAMLMAKYGEPDREPLFRLIPPEWTRGDTFIQSVWPISGDKFFKLESLSLKDDYKMWVEEYKRQMAKEAASSW